MVPVSQYHIIHHHRSPGVYVKGTPNTALFFEETCDQKLKHTNKQNEQHEQLDASTRTHASGAANDKVL